MLRNEVKGAWYSDTDSLGNQYYLFSDSHVEVNRVRFELPLYQGTKENVLFLRGLKKGNSVYLTGQGGRSGNAWLCINGNWKSVGTTFGTNNCLFTNDKLYVVNSSVSYQIFDLQGNWIKTINRQIGVNGIRVVREDDSVITGDETYDGSKLPIHLAEYTSLLDLTVGQSYVSGAIAVRGQTRAQLEPGDCKFIRAYQEGPSFSVVIVKQLENKAVFIYFEIDELKNFPVEPTKTVPPEPEMTEPSSLLEDVEIERAKYGKIPTREELGKLLNEVAWKNRFLGWGLSAKPNGVNVPMPDGTLIASDILHHKPTNFIYDCLWSSGEGAVPTWNKAEFHNDPNRPWIAPILAVPYPNPIPNPNLPNEVIERLENQIVILQNQIDSLAQISLKHGDNIALKTSNSHFLTAENGGGWPGRNSPVNTDRDEVGSWETFSVVKK